MLYSDLKKMVKKAQDKSTYVVNVHETKCDVLVGGKNSKWKLPAYLIRAQKAGEKWTHILVNYRVYLERRARENPNFKPMLQKELKGKVLGCWCKPGPCHADVLAEFANAEEDPNG